MGPFASVPPLPLEVSVDWPKGDDCSECAADGGGAGTGLSCCYGYQQKMKDR